VKIFLDANILISTLNKEYPLFSYSARVLSLVDHKKFQVFTSSLCLAIAFYFAEKKSGTKKAKQKISILASKINITTTDREAVINSINNKAVEDFENGLEYYSALAAGCKCIITEDKDDFHFSEIEVQSAREFLMNCHLYG
jgi:predicted nucleic acid-binding protein